MNKRNSGIDALRFVLMYMICILHILGQGGVLETFDFTSTEFKVFYFFETMAFCSVDGFAIISGFVTPLNSDVSPKMKFNRIIELWFQVLFYSLIVTLIFAVFGLTKGINSSELFTSFYPITSNQYWYFTSYFAASFFFVPIKDYVVKISEKEARKVLIIIFVIYSVLELGRNLFSLNKGYSVIWLLILYFMGLLIKRSNLLMNFNKIILVLFFVISILISWFIYIITENRILVSYTSPTILLAGIILVVLFSKINLKGRILKHISSLSFGIYLFQLNIVVWKDMDNCVVNFLSNNIFVDIIIVLALAFIVFLCGFIVDFIRKKIFDLLHLKRFSIFLSDKINFIFDKSGK